MKYLLLTLLLAVPLWAGLSHQVFAMAVLVMATVHARLSPAVTARPMRPEAAPAFGFEALTGRLA